MPVTINIPDATAARIQALEPTLTVTQIVQTAVQQWADERDIDNTRRGTILLTLGNLTDTLVQRIREAGVTVNIQGNGPWPLSTANPVFAQRSILIDPAAACKLLSDPPVVTGGP